MKKFLILALCTVSLISCERPPIPSRDFEDLTYDMFLVRYYMENDPALELSTDSLSVYGAILEKYGYSVQDYRSTVEYYVARPDDFAKFYKGLQRRIKTRKNALQALVQAENEKRAASMADIVKIEGLDTLIISDLPSDTLRKFFP